ncbi:DUF5682 family protein [Actinocorallia longicatena]|uniref:DUF5682 family protein n=1 Tax=Actinocorallia longicatena TaxID=111803 RepID=A0ABP6PW63_9ACTN
MSVVFVGIRHHSPACARLVADTIERVRPAHVLIEGPADMNDRIGELLLGHRLPVALFTYGDGHQSWTPFCDYSPEWAALTGGRAAGAEVRFIDLPAWHPAFAERANRYADAEVRYTEATGRLCAAFAVDNTDALWDRMFEVEAADDLAERLDAYFALVRGDAEASGADTVREEYMAGWIRAAAAADDGPVVVVTGGFHTPALRRLAAGPGPAGWPEVPGVPEGAGSYLVPYSFRRLDAFGGYQSGMPSPGYYQRVWEEGVEAAGRWLTERVAEGLRRRRQPVSTADLIAARTQAEGLARLRGNPAPARTDVLDGLVSALVSDDLEQPLPWSRRAPLAAGAHPAVVEMVAVLSGDRVGALHPGTPAPPLVREVSALLQAHGLDGPGQVGLKLTDPADLERSRLLHRLRVLGVPGPVRDSGPATGLDPVLDERWTLRSDDRRNAVLIEAAVFGATLGEAAAARLAGRPGDPAEVLFDAALCGLTDQAAELATRLTGTVAAAREPGELAETLATVLALWRHDEIFGTADSALLGSLIDAAVTRVLWLAEGLRGGPAADLPRVRAVAAVRDALRHAAPLLSITRETAASIAGRIAADSAAPPDLRGAAHGLAWTLSSKPGRLALPSGALGDWLIGLFAVAREELLTDPELLPILDDLIVSLPAQDFLAGLPALRQAFEFFPPRERETIARSLLALRDTTLTPRALLRTAAPAVLQAEAHALDAAASALLAAHDLPGAAV